MILLFDAACQWFNEQNSATAYFFTSVLLQHTQNVLVRDLEWEGCGVLMKSSYLDNLENFSWFLGVVNMGGWHFQKKTTKRERERSLALMMEKLWARLMMKKYGCGSCWEKFLYGHGSWWKGPQRTKSWAWLMMKTTTEEGVYTGLGEGFTFERVLFLRG